MRATGGMGMRATEAGGVRLRIRLRERGAVGFRGGPDCNLWDPHKRSINAPDEQAQERARERRDAMATMAPSRLLLRAARKASRAAAAAASRAAASARAADAAAAAARLGSSSGANAIAPSVNNAPTHGNVFIKPSQNNHIFRSADYEHLPEEAAIYIEKRREAKLLLSKGQDDVSCFEDWHLPMQLGPFADGEEPFISESSERLLKSLEDKYPFSVAAQ
ncbi:hypothetical protein HU200_065753 [Digitaria exilis]|uniref:Uncharacterized protein n=1 Tax=Digitaria exilis TaxID=1010633 RepID=A0A835A270_9POAL|nr:hypothetical protein HU200_065753 [Digitaria exilis]